MEMKGTEWRKTLNRAAKGVEEGGGGCGVGGGERTSATPDLINGPPSLICRYKAEAYCHREKRVDSCALFPYHTVFSLVVAG